MERERSSYWTSQSHWWLDTLTSREKNCAFSIYCPRKKAQHLNAQHFSGYKDELFFLLNNPSSYYNDFSVHILILMLYKQHISFIWLPWMHTNKNTDTLIYLSVSVYPAALYLMQSLRLKLCSHIQWFPVTVLWSRCSYNWLP